MAVVLDLLTDTKLLRAALNDAGRLQEVERYDLSNATLRGRLDAIAARTAEHSGMPISLVTILGADRQALLGSHGVAAALTANPTAAALVEDGTTPVAWALCAPMILTGHSHTVTDLLADTANEGNPLVTEFGLRSYLGVPILSADGRVLGGHCLLGTEPHQLRLTDVLALETGAAEIAAALAEHRRPD
jgi:GAF domain-containing protein